MNTEMQDSADGSEKEVRRETASHGARWAAMHGGYFGDPELAKPCIGELMQSIEDSRPDTVVDIGGGTGFLLSQLALRLGAGSKIRLVNMDLSEAQLSQVERPRIEPLLGSLTEFKRESFRAKQLLFACRSVLHYVGIDGLKPALAHVRSQMRPGEYFIHQSACADHFEQALCIDELFERMHSQKWLPMAPMLERACNEVKLSVRRVVQAPPLIFKSSEISARYGIPEDELLDLGEKLFAIYGETPGFFEHSPEGFRLSFPYRIFVCEAV